MDGARSAPGRPRISPEWIPVVRAFSEKIPVARAFSEQRLVVRTLGAQNPA